MDWTLLKPWIPIIGFAVGALVVTALIFAKIWSRESAIVTTIIDGDLEVSNLGASGPPSEGPRLEMYGIPVRLAAVVLAPVGRGKQLDAETLPKAIDQLLFGLHKLMGYHQPEFRQWVEQVSVHGFENAFLHQVKLPGNRGKGTVWSAFAGKFTAGEQQLLAGLVVCADVPNSYGATIFDHDGQWVDCLRVRHEV
jgi:hypothetical protein